MTLTTLTPAAHQDFARKMQSLMQQGKFQEASALADAAINENPQNRDALYLRAVAARYLKDYQGADVWLQKLKDLAPEFGRAFQEEGHLKLAVGNNDAAIDAFRKATRFNPALIPSWKSLASLLRQQGRKSEETQVVAQLNHLSGFPKEVLVSLNLLHEGQILQAEERIRAFLRKHPLHVEAMRLLADIGSRLGVHDDAETVLAAALDVEPDNISVRIDYIQVLRKRQRYAAALEQAELLYSRDPENPTFQSVLAIECMQAGQYERALELFDRVLSVLPDDAATLTSKGHALKTCGRSEEAVSSYKMALASDPTHGDAWYALANLKTYGFSEHELIQLKALADRNDLTFMSRVHSAFALGKAMEDTKNFPDAFRAYARGNALKKSQSRYSTEQMLEEFEAQKRYVTREVIDDQSGKGCPAADPIFIVGLPRAGSTLVEQILASHSQVDGTLELPNILSLAHRLRGRNLITDRDRYPRVLSELSADEFKSLGEDYIRDTQIHRSGAQYFTDKMPNNFRHLGLIHLILPNARIIDARRDPMDCCWSGFKQLFAEGQEFTYDLADIGAYYRSYVDLMSYWESVLPERRILRVQHEDVLDDLEGQVKRILDYCQLPFEEACLTFHKTERAVRTASSEQVRKPLNRSGQGAWQPFEAFLAPLRKSIGDLSPHYTSSTGRVGETA